MLQYSLKSPTPQVGIKKLVFQELVHTSICLLYYIFSGTNNVKQRNNRHKNKNYKRAHSFRETIIYVFSEIVCDKNVYVS